MILSPLCASLKVCACARPRRAVVNLTREKRKRTSTGWQSIQIRAFCLKNRHGIGMNLASEVHQVAKQLEGNGPIDQRCWGQWNMICLPISLWFLGLKTYNAISELEFDTKLHERDDAPGWDWTHDLRVYRQPKLCRVFEPTMLLWLLNTPKTASEAAQWPRRSSLTLEIN